MVAILSNKIFLFRNETIGISGEKYYSEVDLVYLERSWRKFHIGLRERERERRDRIFIKVYRAI